MKKCIIIPDSFKGTMSALEFCQIAEKTVKRHMPGCEVLTIPVGRRRRGNGRLLRLRAGRGENRAQRLRSVAGKRLCRLLR